MSWIYFIFIWSIKVWVYPKLFMYNIYFFWPWTATRGRYSVFLTLITLHSFGPRMPTRVNKERRSSTARNSERDRNEGTGSRSNPLTSTRPEHYSLSRLSLSSLVSRLSSGFALKIKSPFKYFNGWVHLFRFDSETLNTDLSPPLWSVLGKPWARSTGGAVGCYSSK